MRVILLLSVIVLFTCCNTQNKPKVNTLKKKAIKERYLNEGVITFYGSIDTSIITFELANTAAEIQKGLMHRNYLPDSVGMLFQFASMQMRSFWMKNTNIALDIIYVKDDFRIENIEEQAQPFSEYSLPSTGPAQYVIEVNAGYCSKHGIGKETLVKIDYN